MISMWLNLPGNLALEMDLFTFIWPEDDDIQVKTSSDLQSMAAPLPDPATTRRGSVLFPAVTFNKHPLDQIY